MVLDFLAIFQNSVLSFNLGFLNGISGHRYISARLLI